MKIKVLDCTLRDGGYINNWDFGEKCINNILKGLYESKIDIIECGFLSNTPKSTKSKSIFKTINEAEKDVPESCRGLALMINCGEYNMNDIPQYAGGPINTIRIAFHKHQRNEAQELFFVLKERGFNVFFQPMVTMSYTDFELLELIEWANRNIPDAFYIVDSFGTMRKNDVLRIFYLMDNNLNSKIKIGFHSHNNLQLSFSNAQELILMHSERDIIIDTSVFGMGRGAGNLCTELLTQYINENIENRYNIIPILEIMDEHIIPIYVRHPWGYSAPYYIAAVNDCHPNYATYLMNRHTLCVRDINSIIKSISDDKKHIYSEDLISELYLNYQKHNIDDKKEIEKISSLCMGREILILAPGKSLITQQYDIKKYICEHDPIIFAVNHIPDIYNYDMVFVSNLKRFKGIDDAVSRLGEKLICTSNITADKNICVVNYSNYLNSDDTISDNAGLMLINLLIKSGVKKLALAGYDGFNYSENNYFDEKMINGVQYEKQIQMKGAIINYFKNISSDIKIEFITPTIYYRSDNNV